MHAPARDAGLMDNDAERYCIQSLSIPRFSGLTSLILNEYKKYNFESIRGHGD